MVPQSKNRVGDPDPLWSWGAYIVVTMTTFLMQRHTIQACFLPHGIKLHLPHTLTSHRPMSLALQVGYTGLILNLQTKLKGLRDSLLETHQLRFCPSTEVARLCRNG